MSVTGYEDYDPDADPNSSDWLITSHTPNPFSAIWKFYCKEGYVYYMSSTAEEMKKKYKKNDC